MYAAIRTAGLGAVAALLLAGGAVAPAQAGEAPEGVTVYEISGTFEDVRFELENAIVNRGYVIDYVSHIGTMLDRTGEDVGSETQIFTDAQSMLFCSANLSRKAMEADAYNIAYCPYSVFLFETPSNPGTVTVGYRHLPATGSEESRTAIGNVNGLLEEIVSEAAGR